jgi:FkbM family methyltransferase
VINNFWFYLNYMTSNFVAFFRTILRIFDLVVLRNSHYNNLLLALQKSRDQINNAANKSHDEKFYTTFVKYSEPIKALIPKSSSSELHQDLYVLSQLDFKENGFFVEVGAANGVDGSNTFMLEKQFSWSGILVEPSKRYAGQILALRENSVLDQRVVWSSSEIRINFCEVLNAPTYSSVQLFINNDDHIGIRKNYKTKKIKTVSLNDLLDQHKAPNLIDYLSIDIEGSEYEVLKKLDFSKYKFRIITCEHNYRIERELIHSLLTNNGYVREFEELSKYDDWYRLVLG